MIDVNIKGVLYGIAAALPHMKAQKSGHVINVSSVAGHLVRPGSAVYEATKHAVRVISEGLRQEVKPYNIRSTIISPGAVATELPDSITEPDVAEGTHGTMNSMPSRRTPSPGWSPSRSANRKTSTSTKSCSGPPGRNSECAVCQEPRASTIYWMRSQEADPKLFRHRPTFSVRRKAKSSIRVEDPQPIDITLAFPDFR